MRANYKVIEVRPNGSYGIVRISKDVIFDKYINFKSTDLTTLPTDQDFENIGLTPVPRNPRTWYHPIRIPPSNNQSNLLKNIRPHQESSRTMKT
jgi:hypothetical protein